METDTGLWVPDKSEIHVPLPERAGDIVLPSGLIVRRLKLTVKEESSGHDQPDQGGHEAGRP